MSSAEGSVLSKSPDVVFAGIVEQSRLHSAAFVESLPCLNQMRYESPYRDVMVAICMDERCSPFVDDTGAYPGYYTFMQTKGARLHLSNAEVSDTIADSLDKPSDKLLLMIFTVHFSSAHPKHGCAGWNSDTKAAFAHQHRVAEAFRRNYPGQIHTLVLGYDTDFGSLVLPHDDGSLNLAARVKPCARVDLSVEACVNMLGHWLKALSPGHVVHDKNVVGDPWRKELVRMVSANASELWHRIHGSHQSEEREVLHSATRLYAGSGFDFDHASGNAVHVGLHSSAFIDDVELAIEKIVLPEALQDGKSAYVVVNREYDPSRPGELDQARKWVHEVVEDIANIFIREINSGDLHIMESVSTLSSGLQPILSY